MNEESSLGSNPGASCFLWGRFNVAFTNKCPDLSKIASITTFVERICFLKLGFFLELKGNDPTDPVEVHALCGNDLKCEVFVSYKFGTCLGIQKNPNSYILLADLNASSTKSVSWSHYLFAPWPEQSLVFWYYVLQCHPTCDSIRQDEVFVVIPRTYSTQLYAHCLLLTPSDYGSVCTILPELRVESGCSTTDLVDALNRQVMDTRLKMQRFYSQTNPPLPKSMRRPEVFSVKMIMDMPNFVHKTALQPTNVLNDVHLLTWDHKNYLLHEQMQGSTLTHYIPVMLISALLDRFQFIARLLNLKPKSGAFEDANLGQVLANTEEFLLSLCHKLFHALDSNNFLKTSNSKNDKLSMPIPVNLQVYQVRLSEVTNMEPISYGDRVKELTESRSFADFAVSSGDNTRTQDPTAIESKDLRQFSIVTVGCPSPHGMDMGEKTSNGKSYNRFEELTKLNITVTQRILHAKSTKSTLSLPVTTAPVVRQSYWMENSGSDHADAGSREGRNKLYQEVLLRRDLMMLCQVLTPLCTALVNALYTFKDDVIFWKLLMKSKKVNFAWASFINDNGNEYEMLKDFLGVISYVNTYVKFLFCEGDNNFYPTIEADMLGDIIVRIEIPKSKGSLDSRSVFVSQFPADGSGKLYDCCVHFLNQRVIPAPSGADASSATNAIAAKLSNLQTDSLQQLYKSFVDSHLGTAIKFLGATQGQGLETKELLECQDRLGRLLKKSTLSDLGAKFPPNIDHVHDFIHAARISRCIRLTSCKSAKDRTSMSATLEMSKLITSFLVQSKFPARSETPLLLQDTLVDVDEKEKALEYNSKPSIANQDQVTKVIVDSLRRGVRLRNCKINCGRPRYKFTAFNYRYLPPEFKPPESTYTSSSDTAT